MKKERKLEAVVQLVQYRFPSLLNFYITVNVCFGSYCVAEHQ
jgi:hypothetical protein